MLQMIFALDSYAQLSKDSLLHSKLVVLGGRCPCTPAVEHTHSLLIDGSEDSHSMHSSMKILLRDEVGPLGKCPRLFEVDHLGERLVYNFQVRLLCRDIVLPHLEAQTELSMPELVNAALHYIELT